MDKEILQEKAEKRFHEFNTNPKGFLISYTLAVYESVDYNNPLKLEALKFLADIHRHM